MPKEATILLHGWSDSSSSFKLMKDFLVRNGLGPVESVFYADYESREDFITFSDIVDGFNDRLICLGFIDEDGRALRPLNVVAHSTGGLVIRHWIWRYYRKHGDRIDDCPVKRVVMLAPANFGSPLAHRGRSFFGSLLKGRKGVRDFLEVGRQIQTGLEMGSPYQWMLAEGDILTDAPYWTPEKIQLTVLCGADEYSGVRRLVGKDGTDGTVVIAGTPLNSVKLTLDPRREGPGDTAPPYRWSNTTNMVDSAFGVLPEVNHGSIVDVFEDDDAQVCRLVLQALRTRNADDFRQMQKELEEVTAAVYEAEDKDRYQQILVRAVDDRGAPIDDFTLEFTVSKASKRGEDGRMRRVAGSKSERKLSEQAASLMGREFHKHSDDPSYRRFLLNPKKVRSFLQEAAGALGEEAVLGVTVHVPPIDRGIRYETRQLSNVALHPPEPASKGEARMPTFLYPNTTTLVEIIVNREYGYVSLTDPQSKEWARRAMSGESTAVESPPRDALVPEELAVEEITVGATMDPRGDAPPIGLFRRTPHMDLAGHAPYGAGDRFLVTVYSDTEGARAGEAVADITIEAPGSVTEFAVDVTIYPSAHMRVVGDRTRTLALSRDRSRSSDASFDVEVVDAAALADSIRDGARGFGSVTAIFEYRGRPSGQVTRCVAIDFSGVVGGEPEPVEDAVEAADSLRVDSLADENDLTVTIVHLPGDADTLFRCTVRSPHLDESVVDEPWSIGGWDEVSGILEGFVTAEQARRPLLLKAAGKAFFAKTPEGFQRLFWKLHDEVSTFRTIHIVSADRVLPWELALPTRDPPHKKSTDPKLPIGAEYDVGRWTRDDMTASPQCIEIRGGLVVAPTYDTGNLPRASQEADFVQATFGTLRVEPADFQRLPAALETATRGLFHFVGHGAYDQAARHQMLALDGSLMVDETILNHWLDDSGFLWPDPTLVVLNCCQVGRASPSQIRPGGVAQVFVQRGAAAVLAPIWDVTDEAAHAVAQAVYTAALETPPQPLASVLRELRRRSFEEGPEGPMTASPPTASTGTRGRGLGAL